MSTEHLDWSEVTDFSKGLFTAASAFLMPSDGFQTMTDCHPQPGGGLRAWFNYTDDSGTGLPSSGEKPVALASQLVAISSAVYLAHVLVTRVTSTGGLKAYYRAGNSSTWSLSKTFAAPTTATPGDQCQLLTYENNSGTKLWVLGHFSYPNGAAGSTDTGTWTFDGATWTKISGVNPAAPFQAGPPITVYQQRLFYTLTNTIYWTDPGGTTFPAANFLEIDVGFRDISSTPSALVAFSPSTLLVPTSGGSWVSIEGDIDDPVVREMGTGHPVAGAENGWPVAVDDDGVWFYEKGHGYFMAQNMGSTFARRDDSLEPWTSNQAEPMTLTVYDNYVFTPGGYILDKTTGGWFLDSHQSGQSVRAQWDNHDRGLYLVQFKAAPALTYIKTGSDGTRKSTYTVKTAPLRGPDGRQAVIREVQVAVKSFNAEATVAVTVGGTTVTSAALGAGTNVVRFRFNKRAEYLDVQVVPNSNTSTEAPAIEAIRIGHRKDGHYVQ